MPAWQCVDVVQGANVVRGPVLTSTLTKTGGVDAVFNAGASSVNTLVGDGFLEVTGPVVAGNGRCVGLSTADPDQNFTTIGWMIAFDNPNYGLWEMGAQVATGTWVAGDTFRIERRGTTIRYFKNGEVLFTSNTATAAPLMIDSSFSNLTTFLTGIRLYDGTTKTWPAVVWRNVVNATVTAGAAVTTRRLTIAAPPKTRAGDHVVVILASQGGVSVVASNVTWAFVDAVSSANRREFRVLRRRATDEPAAYTIDVAETQEVVALLLVYRNTEDAAATIAASAADVAVATIWPCPKRTLLRATDLYLGLAMQIPSLGGMQVPADANFRANFIPPTVYGFFSPRLLAFDFAADVVGATDDKRATADVATSGAVASFALSGRPPPALSWLPVAPGAIGLPVEGI